MELGQYLKSKRIALGFSQGAIAKKLGYTSPQFISNWERGISSPPLDTLRRIAEIYKISPDEMFSFVLEKTLIDAEKELYEKFYGKKRKLR